jgi:ABC-2 type transport system permease protein
MTAHLRAVWILYQRAIREFIALGPAVLIVPLTVPVFMLVVYPRVFSSVFDSLGGKVAGTPGVGVDFNYLAYIAPATMVMASLLASGSAAVGVAVERQVGYYDRMLLTPLGPGISQAGRRMADATRMALFIVVLSLLAQLNGAGFHNVLFGLAISVPLVAALGVAYGGLAYSLCLSSGSAEATQAITPLFFPILFMSTAFIPLALMPEWLQPIARNAPLSSVCDTVRLAFAGQFDLSTLSKGVAGIAVLALLSQWLIRRAQRKAARR